MPYLPSHEWLCERLHQTCGQLYREELEKSRVELQGGGELSDHLQHCFFMVVPVNSAAYRSLSGASATNCFPAPESKEQRAELS